MTVYAFPDITPNLATFGLSSNTQNTRSELNGVIQTLALPGDIWKAQLTFSNKFEPEAGQLRAFLANMRGRAGRFTMSPPGYHYPWGGAMGGMAISWASGGTIYSSMPALLADTTLVTADSTLTIDGTTYYWLQPGDYIEVLGELKMVTSTVPNAIAETVTINFVPPLRQAVPIGTPLITDHPKCTMQLSDDNQAQWSQQPGKLYALSIACQEALDL